MKWISDTLAEAYDLMKSGIHLDVQIPIDFLIGGTRLSEPQWRQIFAISDPRPEDGWMRVQYDVSDEYIDNLFPGWGHHTESYFITCNPDYPVRVRLIT